MNIILIEPDELDGCLFVCDDRRAEHIAKVLRASVGDRVRIGVINGMMGSGTVTAIKKKFPFSVELRVDLTHLPPSPPAIDLILALPRPIMLRRILSQATTLGVGAIHLINAKRVEKSFWEAGILLSAEYRPHLLHGLEQAMDTMVPEVHIHRKFRPFVEDYLPTIVSNYRYLLLGDPESTKCLGEVVSSGQGRVAMAVGPEGGWLDYEIEKFLSQNFCGCSLGERILKVDTAVIALHSRINALREVAKMNGN